MTDEDPGCRSEKEIGNEGERRPLELARRPSVTYRLRGDAIDDERSVLGEERPPAAAVHAQGGNEAKRLELLCHEPPCEVDHFHRHALAFAERIRGDRVDAPII